MGFGLKARKAKTPNCVEVNWRKVESGACYVKYEVVLKNALGSDIYSETGYNIGETRICRFAAYSNVTDVALIVTFKATSKNVTGKVSDTPVSTPLTTTQGMTLLCSI